MPKQFINTVGALIVAAIVVIATVVIALPIYLQSRSVDDQATTVASQNATQQIAVDALASKKSELGDIEDEVETLTAEIPASARIDTVSALISGAAVTTGVSVASFSPTEPEPFAATAAAPTVGDTPEEGPAVGQVQIPVEIVVSGPNLDSLLAFIDELRAGPRLLGSVSPTFAVGPEGSSVTINALAFAALDDGK